MAQRSAGRWARARKSLQRRLAAAIPAVVAERAVLQLTARIGKASRGVSYSAIDAALEGSSSDDQDALLSSPPPPDDNTSVAAVANSRPTSPSGDDEVQAASRATTRVDVDAAVVLALDLRGECVPATDVGVGGGEPDGVRDDTHGPPPPLHQQQAAEGRGGDTSAASPPRGRAEEAALAPTAIACSAAAAAAPARPTYHHHDHHHYDVQRVCAAVAALLRTHPATSPDSAEGTFVTAYGPAGWLVVLGAGATALGDATSEPGRRGARLLRDLAAAVAELPEVARYGGLRCGIAHGAVAGDFVTVVGSSAAGRSGERLLYELVGPGIEWAVGGMRDGLVHLAA
jgi:hypothetical protein